MKSLQTLETGRECSVQEPPWQEDQSSVEKGEVRMQGGSWSEVVWRPSLPFLQSACPPHWQTPTGNKDQPDGSKRRYAWTGHGVSWGYQRVGFWFYRWLKHIKSFRREGSSALYPNGHIQLVRSVATQLDSLALIQWTVILKMMELRCTKLGAVCSKDANEWLTSWEPEQE